MDNVSETAGRSTTGLDVEHYHPGSRCRNFPFPDVSLDIIRRNSLFMFLQRYMESGEAQIDGSNADHIFRSSGTPDALTCRTMMYGLMP